MNGEDPISLSFYDACLRMSDVRLLHGPLWLNDQVLSFYYEYLSRVKYKNLKDIWLVAPEVTQVMKYVDDSELRQIVERHNAVNKLFIFFALNDNATPSAGGSHWSLLVLSRPERTFYHFDSMNNNNIGASMHLIKQVKNSLGMHQARYHGINCLQQSNGYDCGIHVICMTDHIVDFVSRYKRIEGLPFLHIDTIRSKRAELLQLIHSLGGRIY